MDKITILNNIAYPNVTAEIISDAIKRDILSFDEALNTGEFHRDKQKAVKEILLKYQQEDIDYKASQTISSLKDFILKYPNSINREIAESKIDELFDKENAKYRQNYEKIKQNINNYKPDELLRELGEELLRELCSEIGIDYNVVIKYDEPKLKFNDIPETSDDIPSGYTDVFFWGIPSSGKTCALSAILYTMKEKYTTTSPSIENKFGSTYRDSLTNIFKNEIAYLPAATQKDRTQYMPLLLKRRNEEEKKYRQISFFELSGEVFKYLYELENNCNILKDDDRANVETAFKTLNLLLKSNNQKIHFFFIDYQKETEGDRDNDMLSQENYLNAAATYFRDREDIFKKKTDAVYIIVTKSDQMKSENYSNENITGELRTQLATNFLSENFGNFMDMIKTRCKKDSVDFNVKIFSIGDVYFKSICKINHKYSINIVEDLLKKIKPEEKNAFKKFLKG